MRVLFTLWRALKARLLPPAPGAEPGRDADRRRSVRDVTCEQIGITHWSCHSLF